MRRLVRCDAWLPALVLVLGFLGGCASTPTATPQATPTSGPWSGRLALQVKDQPSQSLSAMFELSGSAQAGELTLSTPVGSTLASVTWTPQAATLRSNGRERQAQSVDALVAQATGAAIPVAALFDWLRGIATQVPGWRVDLSQLAAGRLAAVRLEPGPEADLRVALDR
jgi:outer membrane lipoprotein LolB